MKVKYDLTDNFFKYYNIASGIGNQKKALKKDPTTSVKKYTTYGFYFLGFTLLFLIIGFILCFNNETWVKFFSNISGLLASACLFYFLVFFYYYFLGKKKCIKGTLVVDKDGVSDVADDGVTVKFNWSKIELIVVKDNVIVVIADFPVVLIAVTDDVEKFAKMVKQRNDDVLLIVK